MIDLLFCLEKTSTCFHIVKDWWTDHLTPKIIIIIILICINIITIIIIDMSLKSISLHLQRYSDCLRSKLLQQGQARLLQPGKDARKANETRLWGRWKIEEEILMIMMMILMMMMNLELLLSPYCCWTYTCHRK